MIENTWDNGFDFENMSKEELIDAITHHCPYQKCIKEIEGYNFIVGRYYYYEQTCEDEVGFCCKNICYLSFDEAREHFV